MKQVPGLKILLIAVVAFNVNACSPKEIPLQTLFSSNNCAINEQLLKSIKSTAELEKLFQAAPRNFSSPPPVRVQVDYQKSTVILFALGQKPTAGYAIELGKDAAILKSKTLYIPIRIQQPEKNSLQAQVITSPCRIFSMPKIDFDEIQISN